MALFGPRVARDPLSAEARALIDAAVAAGRITHIPTGVSGLPEIRPGARLQMNASAFKAQRRRITARQMKFHRAAQAAAEAAARRSDAGQTP